MNKHNKISLMENFRVPYSNSDERNEELQIQADMLNHHIILHEVKDLLKEKNLFVKAKIEEDELDIAQSQETVDPFIQKLTLSFIKEEMLVHLKRLRFSQTLMTKAEFEEKENALKSKLASLDNSDLEGLNFSNIREFEEKFGLLPIDEETKRQGMESTFAEKVKYFEDNFASVELNSYFYSNVDIWSFNFV